MSSNILDALAVKVAEVSERLPGQGPGGGPRPRLVTPFINTRNEDLIFLFEWFRISNWGTFITALLIIFIFSVILTVVCFILQQCEREALSQQERLSVRGRLLGGIAFTLRMSFIYLAFLVASIKNLWFLSMLLLGHFIGWVIFSSDTVATPILGPRFGSSGDRKGLKKNEPDDDDSSLNSV